MKQKEKKEKKFLGAFFPGLEPDTACWLCRMGFWQLLSAIKG
jgi:hypothetical protein